MRKNLFIAFSILLINISLYSQSMFQKVFQRDSSMSYGGQQTTDGGYVMGGLSSVTPTNVNYMLVKLDAVGDTVWTKTYGGIGDEESYAMQQTADGGYILAGIDSSSGLGNYNIYLVKTNATGDTLWTKSYGGNGSDFGQAVQQTADGGYIIAGYTTSFGAGDNDAYLLKTDANGNLTWSKTYGGIYGDKAWAVKQTADGGYILAGITSSFGVTPNGIYNDAYVIKTDASGNLTWNKTYGRSGDDWAYGIVQTYDGGYAFTGLVSKNNLDVCEVSLFKIDAIGDTLFTRSFGGTNYDQGIAIIETSDSGLAIAGSSYSFGKGASDLYLIKTNSSGNMLFKSTFGGINNDWAYAMGQTSDKGFALFGYTDNFGVDSSSFYIVKTDANGNSNSCSQSIPTPTILDGVAIIGTPATIVGIPATITANNTHTVIKSGVALIEPCPITTTIKSLKNNLNSFIVYPNPSNGNFTISTTDLKENTQVIIYNQLGQVVLNKQLNNQLTSLNLDVNAGVYQVRVLNGNEVIYQTKIIKE